MSIAKAFAQHDKQQLKELMVKYPFVTLLSHSQAGIEAHHMPLFLTESQGKTTLQGHVAAANPLLKNIAENSEVLLIFNGPNCYISPNYYPTKQQTGRAVPTWNYVAVHVKGLITYHHDADWKLAMLNNLTTQHEANQTIPWSLDDAPLVYINKMLPAIVGLEIEVLSISGQWKVSQNQPEENKRGVIAGLKNEGHSDALTMADLVAERL